MTLNKLLNLTTLTFTENREQDIFILAISDVKPFILNSCK